MNSSAYRIPSIKAGTDLYALPLNQAEGFVLSCIDGSVSIEDISYISGIGPEQVDKILQRLDQLGAISWSNAREQNPIVKEQFPQAPRQTGSDTGNRKPVEAAQAERAHRTLYDPAELEEAVELPMDKRKRILDAYYCLQQQNLYQSLGVSQEATREQIRAAYFELSKVFHPDADFGKRLGSYKAKMETVFKRLTEAYDILGKKKHRQEYDEYLATTAQTAQAQEALDRGVRDAEVLKQAVRDEALQSSERALESAVKASPEPSTSNGAVVTLNGLTTDGSMSSSTPSMTPEQRRQRTQQLLRRRLEAATGRSSTPAAGTPISAPPPSERFTNPPANREQVLHRDSILRGLATSLKAAAALTGSGQRASQQLANAKEFERNGNLIEAANCLRLAATFEPDREDIKAEYKRMSGLVITDLAQRYEKRAQYEERAGMWKTAAESWGKVSEGRPKDAFPARKAAEMLLKAGEDTIRAKKYAERAVELDGKNVSNLIIVSRVYLACGLVLNARRELEKANKLDPGNEVVKNLIKDLR